MGPSRERQPFTCAPASVGDSGAQHRARCPGWAGRVVQWGPRPPPSPVAPGLPGGYLSGGSVPAPAPAPAGVLGNRSRYALPREPPPSAPAEVRSGGGHMEGGSRPPPLGSTFSFSSSPGSYSQCSPHHHTHTPLFFAGHPGQSKPVTTARVAGGRKRRRRRRWRRKSGQWGRCSSSRGPELCGAKPARRREGTARAPGRAGPGATKAVELGTTGRAPSPCVHDSAPRSLRPCRTPRARADPPTTHVHLGATWGLQINASRPWSPRLPGPPGALLAAAVHSVGSDPRETGTRTLWSWCSFAVKSEDAKCCPL